MTRADVSTAQAVLPVRRETVLEIADLTVDYRVGRRRERALRGVSLSVPAGAVTAVIGESGSGKSTLAHAIVRLLPDNAEIVTGSARFGDGDLLRVPDRVLRTVRGRDIGFVPQDPVASLNPTATIGRQLREAYRLAGSTATVEQIDAEIVEDLAAVGLRDPAALLDRYPHELSGGMRQRVLIAMAFSQRPRLVIADEPTSALDVLVGAEVMRSIHAIRRRRDTAVVLVTHDLALAAANAEHVVVIRDGQVVETGRTDEVFTAPRHEYTRELVGNSPRLVGGRAVSIPELFSSRADLGSRAEPGTTAATATPRPEPIIEIEEVSKRFGTTLAVDRVSLTVRRGATLALVGESGSGKTTLSRMVLGLEKPTSGQVRVFGEDVAGLSRRRLRELRRNVQVVYQSPFASLNPRMTVERIVAEPLEAYRVGDRRERARRVRELLDTVQLPGDYASRLPGELSGGQRQRVAIARALALRPALIVLDEPVSALDATIQSQVLDLLKTVRSEFGVTYLLVTHDLAVVVDMAEDIAVMRRGRIVEQGPAAQVMLSPQSPYTQALLSA